MIHVYFFFGSSGLAAHICYKMRSALSTSRLVCLVVAHPIILESFELAGDLLLRSMTAPQKRFPVRF